MSKTGCARVLRCAAVGVVMAKYVCKFAHSPIELEVDADSEVEATVKAWAEFEVSGLATDWDIVQVDEDPYAVPQHGSEATDA